MTSRVDLASHLATICPARSESPVWSGLRLRGRLSSRGMPRELLTCTFTTSRPRAPYGGSGARARCALRPPAGVAAEDIGSTPNSPTATSPEKMERDLRWLPRRGVRGFERCGSHRGSPVVSRLSVAASNRLSHAVAAPEAVG